MLSSSGETGISASRCEPLEKRQLLAADISLFYDFNGDGLFDSITERRSPADDSTPIEFGTATPFGEFSVGGRLLLIKNEGNAPLKVSSFALIRAQLSVPGTFDAIQPTTLAPSGQMICEVHLSSAYSGDQNLPLTIDTEGTDPDEPSRTLLLHGRVLSETTQATNWGQVSGSKSGEFRVESFFRGDGAGNTIDVISDHLIRFELPSGSSHTAEFSLGKAGSGDKGAALITVCKDDDGDGNLDVAEFAKLLVSVKGNLSSTKTSSPRALSAGKYLIYVSAYADDVVGYASFTAKVGMTVQSVTPPQIIVTGNGTGVGAAGEPISVSNGTSFGRVIEGAAPTLTFTVKNSGGSPLNISGQRPNVTGDFVLVEGLSASIGVGQSDTFTIKLINITPGNKTGQVSILSNAALPNFTFAVGGAVQADPNPAFVTRSGEKLTVSGTSGDDTIAITSAGDVLTIRRNGVSNPATFSVRQIKAITVNCEDGNDIVSATTSLRIGMTLNGGAGNDRLRSGKGKDLLLGGSGRDQLDGAGNTDTLDGGADSDYAYYATRNSSLTISLDGKANDGEAGENDLIAANVEHVQGGNGNDTITGNAKGNILRGGPGNDVLNGGKGGDTLDGGPGANRLSGGAGKDVLVAQNDQKDTVSGGADEDALTGDLIDLISSVEKKVLS